MIKVICLIFFLFINSVQANSKTEEEDFATRSVKFITSIILKKHSTCDDKVRLRNFSILDGDSYWSRKKNYCQAKCISENMSPTESDTVGNTFDFYSRLSIDFEASLKSICNKKGESYKFIKDSFNCSLVAANGGKKKDVQPKTDLSNYQGYRCKYDCWQKDGEVVEGIVLDGEPSDKSWIDWNMIKSCRHDKERANIECGYY